MAVQPEDFHNAQLGNDLGLALEEILHWVAALAVLILLLHGWWMTHLVPRPERAVNYAWHAAIGYDLLALVILRVLWRWMNPVPAMPANLKSWEIFAQAGHIGLYVLMFAAALSGWALAGTGRRPFNLDMFGLQIPPIVTDRTLHGPLEDWHMYLSYLLAALVVVHIAGALRHHFIKRNDVMRRMWFGGGPVAQSPDQQAGAASRSASAKSLGS